MVKKKSSKTKSESKSEPANEKGLFIATKRFKDWATGWSFTPGVDKPKELPETLSEGLKNAIAKGIVKKAE